MPVQFTSQIKGNCPQGCLNAKVVYYLLDLTISYVINIGDFKGIWGPMLKNEL